jgi:adenine-specific DNA-methyltransferase
VADYRHKEKRKNNPDAGLATYNFKEGKKVRYSYDPHLDPALVWAGKAEHASFEIDTVSLHIHERISTQAILKSVQRKEAWRQERLFAEPELSMAKLIEFYQHEMDWANRLILGDSLLVMNSLLERELMAGKAQMIYIDPPYGVAYNSNFQPFITKRDVRDGQDESLTREPEQVKAYRDAWELGIHSYLTYLRDRLLLARDLLTLSGSIFVQIGEDNQHHVRELLDEVFGAENAVASIPFKKTSSLGSANLDVVNDYLLWYARDIKELKYHQLYLPLEDESYSFPWIELPDGTCRRLTSSERVSPPTGRLFRTANLTSQSGGEKARFGYSIQGRTWYPSEGAYWKTNQEGMRGLDAAGRLMPVGNTLTYKRYADDFPASRLTNWWGDTVQSTFAVEKIFVVQTYAKVIARCLLMTTDPGDLVFDPTCGSGTTAFVAEQYGRRWITCDTSRVAIALARQRIMTATLPYYKLVNPELGVDGGFVYKTVPHITLRSIAQNEPSSPEALYDHPLPEADKVRVSGPFTVEAIPIATIAEQDHGPATSGESDSLSGGQQNVPTIEASDYVGTLIRILSKDGVTFPKGKKLSVDGLRPLVSSGFLHAEGIAGQNGRTLKVAFSFGPRYSPVSIRQVDEALRLANRMGFDVLIIAGFAVDPEARAVIDESPIPKLEVHFANVSPDVIVGDLLKHTRGSQLFTVFGEPDVRITRKNDEYSIKLQGVDIYDPVTGEVHQSDGKEVPAWFLDEEYDGLTFRVSQAFFPKEATSKNPWDRLENALHGVIDTDRIEAFRGLESLPFKPGKEKRIAVKVIDIRGNEVMVVRKLTEEKNDSS